MSTEEATDSLDGYIPRPEIIGGRQMVGINAKDHARITELAKQYDTSNGRIITALLAFYDDEP